MQLAVRHEAVGRIAKRPDRYLTTPVNSVRPGVRSLLSGLMLIACAVTCGGSVANEGAMDPAKFLEIVARISEIHDLRDYHKISAILGTSFSEIGLGRQMELRPTELPGWLGNLSYALVGVPPGTEVQVISLYPKLCITPEDVRMRFGNPNISKKYPPVIPSFIDEKSAKAYLDEIQHGPGVIGMDYRLSQKPDVTLQFYFGLRKCLQRVSQTVSP